MQLTRHTHARLLAPWLAIVSIGLFAVSCGANSPDRRHANKLEFAYSYLASDLHMPEICEKISPRAYLAAGMIGEKRTISYTRSACYYNLARKTNNAKYCANVIEVEDTWIDGSLVSEEHCRQTLSKVSRLRSHGGDPEWLLRFMGFTESDLGGRDWIEFAVKMREPGAQHDRAALLPDFSREDGAVEVGVSYEDLGCSDDQDEDWYCYAHRCLDSSDEELREACLQIAAYLQTRQRVEALGRSFAPSGRDLRLLKKYPELKTFTLP